MNQSADRSTLSELPHGVMEQVHLLIAVDTASTNKKMQLQPDTFI
jgi:hypothetical protein